MGSSLDLDLFALHLAVARRAEGLELAQVAVFDPDLHPRDLEGRFRKTLAKLLPGHKIKLPSGVQVNKLPAKPYVPHGKTDEESYDFTDDPELLKLKFSKAQLEDALLDSGNFVMLKFDYEEQVPRHAVLEALGLPIDNYEIHSDEGDLSNTQTAMHAARKALDYDAKSESAESFSKSHFPDHASFVKHAESESDMVKTVTAMPADTPGSVMESLAAKFEDAPTPEVVKHELKPAVAPTTKKQVATATKPDSPARSPTGKIRNIKQMNTAKLNNLTADMVPYANADPDAADKIVSEQTARGQLGQFNVQQLVKAMQTAGITPSAYVDKPATPLGESRLPSPDTDEEVAPSLIEDGEVGAASDVELVLESIQNEAIDYGGGGWIEEQLEEIQQAAHEGASAIELHSMWEGTKDALAANSEAGKQQAEVDAALDEAKSVLPAGLPKLAADSLLEYEKAKPTVQPAAGGEFDEPPIDYSVGDEHYADADPYDPAPKPAYSDAFTQPPTGWAAVKLTPEKLVNEGPSGKPRNVQQMGDAKLYATWAHPHAEYALRQRAEDELKKRGYAL